MEKDPGNEDVMFLNLRTYENCFSTCVMTVQAKKHFYYDVTLHAFLPIGAYTRNQNLPSNAGKSGITIITLKVVPSLQKNKQKNKQTRTRANNQTKAKTSI